MNFTTLLYASQGRVATIMVNRPERLNALNAEAKRELLDVFKAIQTDGAILVVIITGSGDKSFVAGTDIGELATLEGESGKEFSLQGQKLFDLIENLGKPVIAAVNGYALGAGCELAMACHVRIASDKSRFGQPEVGLGIIPGYGGTQRLARIVGVGKALEMILTGTQVDADEALRIGLVNRVVPHAELISRTRHMAEVIASNGQAAVRRAMRAVGQGYGLTFKEGQQLEATLFGECCATADFKEGTKAFLEKRKPEFRGEP